MTIDERLDQLEKKVDDMHDMLTKYKGFVGGLIFAVSAIWAAGIAILSYVKGGH